MEQIEILKNSRGMYIRLIFIFCLSVLVCLELEIIDVIFCCFSLSLLLVFRNFYLGIKVSVSVYTAEKKKNVLGCKLANIRLCRLFS